MPNNLTGLIATLYNALDVVSREMTGFIPAVARDMTMERAALNQEVLSPVAPVAAARDIVPGSTRPNDGDQDIGNVSMKITKSRAVPIRWNGEQRLGVDNKGAQFNVIFRDQAAQAMRTLVNEVEADVAALAKKASRAYGTAGTTPFATDLKDVAQMGKILKDNGAPQSDLQMVLDTSAGANLRTLGNLNKVNENGDDSMLRRGIIRDLHGFSIRESGQIITPASGTSAGSTTNNAGYAVGATLITLAAAGTGAILQGDVITFAGDTNKYLVASGDADVSGGGTITLVAPGLRKAIPTAATAITVIAASTRNLAFSRNAMVLATRAPAVPPSGDTATDRTLITDPQSGLTFEVAIYPEYRQVAYEVGLAWGCEAIKGAHIASLLG